MITYKKVGPCWYDTKLDNSFALKSSFSFPNIQNRILNIIKKDDIFTAEWIDYMKKFGFTVIEAVIFYKPPNFKSEYAHLDLSLKERTNNILYAFNWTICGEDGVMEWFNFPNNDNIKVREGYSAYKHYYIEWDAARLEKVDEKVLNSTVTIVRPDVPHLVSTNKNGRWCVSARVFFEKDDSWEKTINRLNDKNLLFER